MISNYSSFHPLRPVIWKSKGTLAMDFSTNKSGDVSVQYARPSVFCFQRRDGNSNRNWRPYYSGGRVPPAWFTPSSPTTSSCCTPLSFPTLSTSFTLLFTPVRFHSSSSTFDPRGKTGNAGGGAASVGGGSAGSQEEVMPKREESEANPTRSSGKKKTRNRITLQKKGLSTSMEQVWEPPLLSPISEAQEGAARHAKKEGNPIPTTTTVRTAEMLAEDVEGSRPKRRGKKKAPVPQPIPPPSPSLEENKPLVPVEGEGESVVAVDHQSPRKKTRGRKRKEKGHTVTLEEKGVELHSEERAGSASHTDGKKGASFPHREPSTPSEQHSRNTSSSDIHTPSLFSPSGSLLSSDRSAMGSSPPSSSTSSLSSDFTTSALPFTSTLPDLGIEEGIRFFSNLRADTRHLIREESLLVYNTLTGRMTNDFSPSMQILLSIGFGLNEQRQVVVADPEKLNRVAERIRSGETTLEKLKWPPSLMKKIGSVMKNARIADPAEAIQQLIKVKINTISLARYSSVVAGKEEGSESSVEDGSNLLQREDPEDIKLNEEQERAIEIALRGHHLYIGGSAGTGKTVLLRILCRRLQAHRLRVAMTATTGVAGCHIGGSTFHHAFGVSSQGEFIRRTGMLDFDVVIIDEISMMSQRLFETFDQVLREEAGTPDLPFGGVQIILCGDFLQLGSINESSVIYSRMFQKCFVKMRLQTIVRQNAYPEFAADLQLMRRGIVPANLTKKIQQLPPGTMVPAAVNLLPTNKEVHAANEKEMERLQGIPLVLLPETGITGLRTECTATMLLRTTPAFSVIEFSKHILSLLQSSLDLPRASLLSVYKVYDDGHAMRVVLPPGESAAWKEAMRERFLELAPLINELDLEATVTEIVPDPDGLHTAESEEYLQCQMTKHPIVQPLILKQGCRVLLRSNLSSVFVNGSIGTVVDFVECAKENFPEYLRHESMDNCIERYRVFCLTECAMPIPMVPVVQFHNGKTVPIPPWEFTVGGCPNTHYYSLSSVCIPLTLAYAFTVHKVQGLTLVGRVHLELSKMWPCEHLLYVAMSRVRNPDQLSLSSFQPNMIVANKDCVRFDIQLKDAMALTQEVLNAYPVASWKRCTDTIYQLRRRGSSLRALIKEAALGSQQHSRSRGDGSTTATLSSSPLSENSSESDKKGTTESTGESSTGGTTMNDDTRRVSGANGKPAFATLGFTTRAPSTTGSPESAFPSSENHSQEHLLAVENSVIVARRLRKLVAHVEREARLRAARLKGKGKTMKTVSLDEEEKKEVPMEEPEEGEDAIEDDERPLSGVEHF